MHDLQNDIEKYLSGKLTPAEMHALEKRALDDPFLAEALEGGSTISPQDFSDDIRSLNTSILSRKSAIIHAKHSFWTWPLRIAAGLILLAVSAYIVINIADEKNQENSLALNQPSLNESSPKTSTPIADSVSSHGVMQKSERSKSSDEPASQESVPQKDKLQEEAEDKSKPVPNYNQSETLSDQEEEVIEEEEIDIDKSIAASRVAESEISREEEAREKSLDEAKKRSEGLAQSNSSQPRALKADVPTKTIKGKVTDVDDGLPLPGVNVLVQGSTTGTTTDLNGNYEIVVPETNKNIVFSFIGMESQEVVVASDQTNQQVNVQLAPDVSELSEVVVVGYGTGEEKELEDIKWELTEPEGGKKAYRNYLESNLRYPQVALENKVEGKVTVQFTVEPNGQLSDFRVVKSLGSGCDNEVIRLIKEGAKWTPTRRNEEPVKSKAKVKVRFALPGKKK